MIPDNHPENNEDIELNLSDEEFDFNNFLKNSDHFLDQKFDDASSETTVCLVSEIVKHELPGDVESYAKMAALVVLKLRRLIKTVFEDDKVADSFTDAVIACIRQDIDE